MWFKSIGHNRIGSASANRELKHRNKPSIGMFNPEAGNVSTSGVAVFNREASTHLAELQPTYLYTEPGSLSTRLRNSGVNTIEICNDSEWERIRSVVGRAPFTLESISPQISSSISSVMNAVLDGTLKHIDNNIDVLFTHHLSETILLSNILDVPIIRVLHGFRNAGIGAKAELYLANSAATIANSQYTAQTFRKELRRDVDDVVYPGVRTELFTPTVLPAVEYKDPVIMFAGRLNRSKGVFDLLKAVAMISEDVHLLLVGRGDEATVQNLTDTLSISDQVTVVGEVDHEQLPHYYVAADIFCLPTRVESFGMVNLEAMACATPVVTTNLPGIQIYANDEENCLLFSPGNIDTLAKQLSRLLSSHQLRKQLGDEGRSTAKQFTWERTAKDLSTIAEFALVE